MLHIGLDFWVLELTTNQSLESEDCVVRVHDSLTLSRQTNQSLAMFRERNDRRCCPCTLGVLNHSRRLALHDGDARICRSQVNTDDGSYRTHI